MMTIKRLWGRKPPPEPEVLPRCFTEDDVIELAERLFQERVRRANPLPMNQPTKFTPVVIDSDRRICWKQVEVDGVIRRVQTECPT